MKTSMLEHDALVYGSDDEYVGTLVPFLREGIEQGHGAVVAADERRSELLAAALGADATRVHWAPSREVYRSPAAAIAAYDRVLATFAAEGFSWVRAVGEVEYGAKDADHERWMPYEPLAHRAFEQASLWVVCPYDTRTLPVPIIEHARRTHPRLLDAAGRSHNDDYLDPESALRRLGPRAKPVRPEHPELTMIVTNDFTGARASLRSALSKWLDRDRTEEAIIATSEILANVAVHGRGRALLSAWSDERTVTCEVIERGGSLRDPFAGFRPPPASSATGRGLWIARNLADDLIVTESNGSLTLSLAFARQR